MSPQPLYFGFFPSCTQLIECSPAPTAGSPRPCTGSQAPAQAPVEQPRWVERGAARASHIAAGA
eukprot:scaffold6354_cov126-Isochrysis_galbana.AAC.5